MRRVVTVWWLVLAACGESTAPEPEQETLRHTVLFYREDTGEAALLNSDDGQPHPFRASGDGLVPVGLSSSGDEVALLSGRTLLVASISSPGRLDTLLATVPVRMSLVAFSPDDRYVALFQYLPEPALLVLDRAGRPDTIRTPDLVPSVAPAFSPDGTRIALLTVTALSLRVTVVTLGTPFAPDQRAGFSRLRHQPVFGWPRWTERGILVGTIRTDTPTDSLVVLALNPDQPSDHADFALQVAAPNLTFDAASAYALSADGRSIVVAAVPAIRGGRQLYVADPARARLIPLLSDTDVRPAFPLLLPPSPAASSPSVLRRPGLAHGN